MFMPHPRGTELRLERLPVNDAWCFTFGSAITPVSGRSIFETREEAVDEIGELGLAVDKDGVVTNGKKGTL